MIRQPIAPGTKRLLGFLSVLTLIAAYSYLSWSHLQETPDSRAIPSWSQMWSGFLKSVTPQGLKQEYWLPVDSAATFGRLGLGMLCGIGLSILLGFLMGCWTPAAAFLEPPLAFIAKLNPIAMLSLFYILVGVGIEFYITMIAFGITPVLAQTIYLSARDDVPSQLIHKSYTLGASHMEAAILVIARQVLPKLLDGVRLLIGPALVYLLAAEMINAGEGFGYRIRMQLRLVHMDVAFPYILMLAMFGFLADQGLKWSIARFCPWYGERA